MDKIFRYFWSQTNVERWTLNIKLLGLFLDFGHHHIVLLDICFDYQEYGQHKNHNK